MSFPRVSAFVTILVLAMAQSGRSADPPAPAGPAVVNELTQHGITWRFDKPVASGRFVNGDYWVVGPVKITGITPRSEEIVGTTTPAGFAPGGDDPRPRTMNGAMLNPMPTLRGMQGFDSDMYQWQPTSGRMYGPKYKPELNVALGVSAERPLLLQPGSSLVSSISHEKGSRPQLKSAAILTVLAEPPPEGGAATFRPPYAGPDKPLYSSKKLRRDLLPNLPLVGSMPDLKALTARFERPWIDHFSHLGDGTQYSSPSDNMPNYGREYSMAVGAAALMVLLDDQALARNYGQGREELLVRFVQLGIDLYHITEHGGYWWGKGGLNQGRKWPIIFAGLMLDHQRMRTIGQRSPEMPFAGFAEDSQTKYIDEADVAMTHSPRWAPDTRAKQRVPYGKADIGLPEWNVGGFARGLTGSSALNNTFHHPYRVINGMSYPGVVLPALLLGQKEAWNHDALFDYTDRYVAWAPRENPNWNDDQKSLYTWGGSFQRAMWEAYRGKVAAPPATRRVE